jgi:diaminopimelate decarboxylase
MKNNINELVNKYGFPLYVYYENIIKNKIEILKNTFEKFEILYSYKANPNKEIINFLRANNIGADVASINEVKLANKMNISKEKILYSSPGKVEEDINYAIENSIIIANSYSELKMIDKICKEKNKKIKIGIRINPNVEFNEKNIFEIMGGRASQFGIDEETLLEKKEWLYSLEYIEIIGIHVYMGSGILNYKLICDNFRYILNIVDLCINKMNFNIKFIDFGGGFGIPYTKKENKLDMKSLNSEINEIFKIEKRFNIDNIRLIIESGRFLTAEAGKFITKVVDIKKSRGEKYIIVHGGMNGFYRPNFTRVIHPTIVYNSSAENEKVTICGNMCTPLDIIAKDILLPKINIGDIIVISNAGSYGYTMSLLEFISQRQPKEIYIKNI